MADRPLVQWSFLQYKKILKSGIAPAQCFSHSATQIGSKILIYGGCDYAGVAQNQLILYDTATFQWSSPGDATAFQEDHPGSRYGHSATLIEMHPPKIMIYGGVVDGGTFEFETPNGVGEDFAADEQASKTERSFMSWRKKGKQNQMVEETDDAVYFLTLNAEKWVWSKPLIPGGKESKPRARTEHSACRTDTNEVTIFGGWTDEGPQNDMWTFNFVNMEWRQIASSGIQPKPRYRHTAEMVGYKMYVFGGSDNGDDVADKNMNLGMSVLSLDTMQWSHPSIQGGANPFPRSGHSSTIIGAQTVAIFGGKRNNQVYLNDLVLIDLETCVATTVNAVENCLPTAVSNCSMSAVGNKCFVFGGTDVKGACYNDIRSLDVGHYLNSDDITVGEGASSDYSFKILIIGDASVGKSALLTRFSENTFLTSYTTTIGIDFNSRMIRVDKAICKLEIWDTAGQERFSTITANYYRGAQGALLVYDISRRESFEHVKNWYERAKQLGGEDLETVLVGNKCDLSGSGETADLLDFGGTSSSGGGSASKSGGRAVTIAEGEALAKELGVPAFLETSALNGVNVDAAFVAMTLNIKRTVDRKGLTGVRGDNLQSAGGVMLASGERRSRCGCT